MIRTLAVMLAWMAAMVFADGVAGAQEPFRPETLESRSLDQQQRDEIKAFVKAIVEKIRAGKPAEVMQARRAAQRELSRPEVRVPFRLDFASAAATDLGKLAQDPNDLIAINAIYVMGDVGAGATAVALLDSLKDQREAVRYAAVVALEKTFAADNGVLPQRDIDVVGRQVEAQLKNEKSSKVLAAYVRTLSTAADPTQCELPGMRQLAIRLLGRTFAERVARINGPNQPVDAAMMDAMLLAGETLRRELTRVGANMSRQEAIEAARLGGHLLAYARSRLQAGNVGANDQPNAPRTERQNLADLARLGEQITTFAGTKVGVNIPPRGLPELVGQKKDAEFTQKVAELIGADGVLTAEPFGYADDEFLK